MPYTVKIHARDLRDGGEWSSWKVTLVLGGNWNALLRKLK